MGVRKLIRRPALLEFLSLSRTTVDRLEAAGEFPKRIQVGRRVVAWDEGEVMAWEAARHRGPRQIVGLRPTR